MSTREVALSNVGPGPDPLRFTDLDAAFAVVLLHRDYYCSNCRQQVRRVKSRYDEFDARDAEVVSVLPEGEEEAAEWQAQYDLPYPLVADPDHELGDRFDQPTRFGLLGKVHDVIGRMPATVVLDLRGDAPEPVFSHRGSSPADRPTVDEVLAALDRAAAGDGEGADGVPGPPRSGFDGPVTPAAAPEGVAVRVADGEDLLSVMRVLHGALLDIEMDAVRDAVGDGDVLVAEDDGWAVGACVVVEGHVEAIAVRRERRHEGIATALVETAAHEHGRLTADFRAGVRGFWEAVGFDVEKRDGRLRGERVEG